MRTISITVDLLEAMRLLDWAFRGVSLDADIRMVAMEGIIKIPKDQFEASTSMIAAYPGMRALAISLNRAIQDSTIDERKEIIREIPKRFGSTKH
jgi:hypothetical protein